MRTRTSYLFLSLGLIVATAARSEQWFTVASPGTEATGTRVEVDLDSVHPRGPGGEAVIRVTYDILQPHNAGFHFRSLVASALFDCHRRTISLTSATYYAQPAGAGRRVGSDNWAKESGLSMGVLDSVPLAARRALVKATCATTHTSGN